MPAAITAANVLLRSAVLGALLAAALGCAPAAAADARPGEPLALYVLHPMDLLKLQVFQEPDLDRELRVSQDSTITVPLIGVVDLKGRTIHEAEELITELYARDYLVNPQINITILEYAPRTVNVLGAVNAPGAVAMPPEKSFTLLDAIARAGGFSRLANRGRVSLTRSLPGGRTENFTVNADQLVSGDAANRWPMHDGDVVYVPERVL